MGILNNKTVIITGASAGFGRATAIRFAEEGANLVLTARREERLKELVSQCREIGAKAVYYAGDAREEETAKAVIKLAIDMFGQVDILDNNAGIGRTTPLVDTTMEEYNLIMDSNVRSAFAFTKYAVPPMLERGSGHIILTFSVTGIKGHADEAAYTCSKFALRGLGQALDKELLSKGIVTTVFCPHAGSTEFEVGYGRGAEGSPKWLTAEDVAQALLTVCMQTPHCHIHELCLASNNETF